MIPFRSENYLGIISGSTEKTLGIISGSGSFQGQFGDHFGVGDYFVVGIISGAVHISKSKRPGYMTESLLQPTTMMLCCELQER